MQGFGFRVSGLGVLHPEARHARDEATPGSAGLSGQPSQARAWGEVGVQGSLTPYKRYKPCKPLNPLNPRNPLKPKSETPKPETLSGFLSWGFGAYGFGVGDWSGGT